MNLGDEDTGLVERVVEGERCGEPDCIAPGFREVLDGEQRLGIYCEGHYGERIERLDKIGKEWTRMRAEGVHPTIAEQALQVRLARGEF